MRTCFLIFILFFSLCAYSQEFGEYRYSKYLGLQSQLQNQRMRALRYQRRYNQNPARNIYYPRRAGQYPNIERNTRQRPLTRNQRYSPNYYNHYSRR